ncbi:MAG TPA: APC family permease [Bryobacteraceae bacterium]|nr:APC family permease [Bryobacteraceae bacterium]
MSIIDFLIGRPIATSDERAEQIGTTKGIPIFGLDALSSAAYGPEAALTLLIPLGLAGLNYIVPISLSIIGLLLIVFFSYCQTIEAYPQGGGSYTVAHENLGTFAGLLAAAALMIDYVLTAAVGISAGIGALTSAVPSLHPRTLILCLAALVLITLVNLRGVGETGKVFLIPTYLFLICMIVAIAIGVIKALASGGHPIPVVPPPSAPRAAAAVSTWLLLKVFSSGCTAMTGVEAVSNGVRAFREPRSKIAQRTLAIIIACLVVMLAGIAFLTREYKIVATDPDGNQYRSVLSMLFDAVAGHGWFYFVAIGSVLLVLIFSANTAFADFPRVCRVIAEDHFLPVSFANRGRRLVYSQGIVVLATLTAILLIGFGGVTDRLIPLYAVGAFLAFTLSQAGMLFHWRKARGRGAKHKMFINGLGALATGATVIVVILSKFTQGAWITVVTIPAILMLMYGVRRHYQKIYVEVESKTPLDLAGNMQPLVVVPLQQWSKIAKHALCAAFAISKDVRGVFVIEENKSDELRQSWHRNVVTPARAAGAAVPELVVLESPYRFVVNPIVDYVIKLSADNPKRRIIAMVPEVVENRWYNYFLHSQRATLLKTLLLVKGNDRISVLNVPWYLK